MKLKLDEGSLPGLLRNVYVQRLTGIVHLHGAGARRTLMVRRGQILRADRVDECLATIGLLSPTQLSDVRKAALRERKPLSRVLEENGLLTAAQIEDALVRHVHECFAEVLSRRDATWELEPLDPEAPMVDEITMTTSTGQVILDVVRGLKDDAAVARELGNLDRVLAPSMDPMLRYQQLPLSSEDGYVLSRIDGITSAAEVIHQIPLETSVVQRCLLALVSIGTVDFTDAVRPPLRLSVESRNPAPGPKQTWVRPPEPMVPPAPDPAERPPASSSPAPRPPAQPPATRPPAPSAPPARPAPVAPAAPPPPKVDRRQEIVAVFDGLKASNHFEVLGITPAADANGVKDAYFRLAKRFHPDVERDPELADVRDKLERIFIRLGEAYEILRNPRTRAAYEQDLAARAPKLHPSGPFEGAASAGSVSAPEAAAVALQSVRQAERLMLQEKFFDAIQLLEPAVEDLNGKVKHRALIALGRCYAANPKWMRRAEKVVFAVVTEDPGHIEGHLLLGGIYESSGLKARAASTYRTVLDLDLSNKDAIAALERLAPPTPDADSESGRGGLLRKIFGKP